MDRKSKAEERLRDVPKPRRPTTLTPDTDPTCAVRHEWFYDHHRAGMLCGKCGKFVSDMT